MRFPMLLATAMLLLLPAARQANACEDAMPSAQATTAEYSAETHKKPMKTAHKKKHRKKKEKVEYMRAAPMK